MRYKSVFWFVLLVFSLSLVSWVYADEISEKFDRAKELYKEGQYSESFDVLKELVGEVEKLIPTDQKKVLEFVEDVYVPKGGDNFSIDGVVKNVSDKTIEYVQVTAKMYDSNKKLMGIKRTYSRPSELSPGQEGTFQLFVIGGASRIKEYSLSATWK